MKILQWLKKRCASQQQLNPGDLQRKIHPSGFRIAKSNNGKYGIQFYSTYEKCWSKPCHMLSTLEEAKELLEAMDTSALKKKEAENMTWEPVE